MKVYHYWMVTLLSLGLTGAVNAQETSSSDPSPPPAYDFVQQAGSMNYDGGEITLRDASAGVIYFSERPYRIGGQLSNADFASFWDSDQGFKLDPPNAVVSILENVGQAPAVVELTSARMDGEDIVYGVTVLRGDLPESANGVALFIDRAELLHRNAQAAPHQAGAAPPPPHGGAGFNPYGPYCYHAPQDPRCQAWHHPYHPYHPYPPPHGPYYHPGAAYAAGVATGAAIANSNQPPVYYYYPLPTGPMPANCWINSQHTQMVCSVPLAQ